MMFLDRSSGPEVAPLSRDEAQMIAGPISITPTAHHEAHRNGRQY